MSCRPAKAAAVAATQVLALPAVSAAAQEPIVEVAPTPAAKVWAIFSPSSAGGRPESGQASRGGLGSHHSEMISAVPSRKGAPASKLEKRRIAIADLESRIAIAE